MPAEILYLTPQIKFPAQVPSFESIKIKQEQLFSKLSNWANDNDSDFKITQAGNLEFNYSSISYNRLDQKVTHDGLFVRYQGPVTVNNPKSDDVFPMDTVKVEAKVKDNFITCLININDGKVKREVMNLNDLNNIDPENTIEEWSNSNIHQIMPNIVAVMQDRGHSFSEIRYGMYTYSLIEPKFQGVNGIILCMDSKELNELSHGEPKIFNHIPVYCVVTGDKVDEKFLKHRWGLSSITQVNDINDKANLKAVFESLAEQISKDNSENLAPKP